MSSNKIRLIALDLDGTLLNSKGEITPLTRAAIEAARERGIFIALATGRRFRDSRTTAIDLGLDLPLISHNGALTKHARSLETVAVKLLPLAEARDVIRLSRLLAANPMISDDPEGLGVIVYDRAGEENRALAAYLAWSKRVADDFGQDAIRRVASLEEYLDHSPVHIAFSGSCEQMEAVEDSISAALGARVQIHKTVYKRMNFTLIDILHPDASKGTGLAAVANEYGISPSEVMSIGDNFNDLAMLRYAGIGVVMGNADQNLQQIEGLHITASNDQDGVARAIEQFALGTSGGMS